LHVDVAQIDVEFVFQVPELNLNLVGVHAKVGWSNGKELVEIEPGGFGFCSKFIE
jgi:hypothetical protein